MPKIEKSFYGDLMTWVLDTDVHNKLFRVWYSDDPNEDEECSYEYFTEIIELGNGDYLIGMQGYDCSKEDKRSTSIWYHRLSEIKFAYVESDQYDEEEENTDE